MGLKVCFGIFETRSEVEKAVDTLRAQGFRCSDISVLFPDCEGPIGYTLENGTKATEGVAPGKRQHTHMAVFRR